MVAILCLAGSAGRLDFKPTQSSLLRRQVTHRPADRTIQDVAYTKLVSAGATDNSGRLTKELNDYVALQLPRREFLSLTTAALATAVSISLASQAVASSSSSSQGSIDVGLTKQERVAKLKATWRSVLSKGSGSLVGNADVLGVFEEGDTTSGWLAFSDIPLQAGAINADIGGGKSDYSTMKLKEEKGVTNLVFDPFARSDAHNEEVLEQIGANPTDTATSFSILNVIKRKEDRLAHIQFVYDSIKYGGTAYLKAWPGNGSGKETQAGENGLMFFQSNRGIETYIDEIEAIFGKGRAIVATEKFLASVQKGQEQAFQAHVGITRNLEQPLSGGVSRSRGK